MRSRLRRPGSRERTSVLREYCSRLAAASANARDVCTGAIVYRLHLQAITRYRSNYPAVTAAARRAGIR